MSNEQIVVKLTYSSIALGRSVHLVASLLLKLVFVAVTTLSPPKALGLQVSEWGFQLWVLAVLNGLLSQRVRQGPEPCEWPCLGWVIGTGKVLVHDGAFELRPELRKGENLACLLLWKKWKTYASSKWTEMHLDTSRYEEPLQSCPLLDSLLGRPLTEARARAATTTNAFIFELVFR